MVGRRRSRITIRKADPTDATALADVYVDSGRHHAAIDPVVHQVPDAAAAVERIRTKLADAGRTVFLAEEAREVVGLLEVERVPEPAPGAILRAQPTASVGIAVREDRRGQGIGTELMAFAERWAHQIGCTTMILDMSAANEEALRFYERLGYRTYGLMLRKALDGG